MIITGTITQAGQASEPSGQFSVRYQDITITDPNGKEWYGRIGSKQGYQENTPISVTVEVKQGESGEYNYFRKHNPQYADRNAPQKPQQAPSHEPQQPKPDWDAIAEGKVRHGVICALLNSHPINEMPKICDIEYWVNYIITGRAPLPPSKIPEPDPDITEPQEPAY